MSVHPPSTTGPPARPGQGEAQSESLSLAAAVFRFAQSRPGSPALVVDDRTVSYGELARCAANIGAWLAALGVSAGASPTRGVRAPRVGILATRSLETFAGMLGAAWVGATYVPINPRQPAARIASILERAKLDALIGDASAASLLDDDDLHSAMPPHVLRSLGSLFSADGPVAPPASVGPGHPAYVIFTSGTTGVPKGVVVRAGALAHFLSVIRELYAIGPTDRVGQFHEVSFDLSVFEIFAAWDGGASLYVVPEKRLLSPAAFIRQHELSVWASVPSLLMLLARMKMLEPGMFPSLRVSFFIGEALPAQSARAWRLAAPNSVVDNHYGPTEATVACTMQPVRDPIVETPGRGTVAIGLPYHGMHAEVVDDHGGFVADGVTGELALHGPQLADGYLDDPEQTAARFPDLDHPRLGRGRWYLTGDLAFRDDRGVLHCLGRIDHQVKVMGHRIELEDLEAHLRSASGSDSVAAVAWPLDGASARGLVAFVCDSAIEAAAIRERLKQLVPAYMLPRQIRIVATLPRSASGKIDRKALQAMLESER